MTATFAFDAAFIRYAGNFSLATIKYKLFVLQVVCGGEPTHAGPDRMGDSHGEPTNHV